MATETKTRKAGEGTVLEQRLAAAQAKANGTAKTQPNSDTQGKGGKTQAKQQPKAKAQAQAKAQPKDAKPAEPTKAQRIFALTNGYCLCGCGSPLNAGRYFVQGHDARAKGMLLKVRKGEMAESELPATLQRNRGLYRDCECCGSPVLVGKSVCHKEGCNCKERAAIAKAHKKPKGEDGSEAEGEEE